MRFTNELGFKRDKTILKLIWNEKPMMEKKVFRVEGILKDDNGEDEYDWIFNYYINSKLFYALNLKKSYLLYTDDYEEFKKQLPKTGPCCCKCFDEFIEKNNIKIISS